MERFRTHCDKHLEQRLRQLHLDTAVGAFDFKEARDLSRPGLGHRQWLRFSVTDETGRTHELFMKRYLREPLSWRIRRYWTYGQEQSPAGVEFDNIVGANQAGVPTMEQVAAGEEFDTRGAVRSYTIVSAVRGAALEQCAEEFLERSANNPRAVEEFTARLAELAAKFHASGYVHRDFYSSHVFMDESSGRIELRLIDLARAFIPRRRKMRWRVKDLAQLLHSMPEKWSQKHWDKFLSLYLGDQAAGQLGRWRRAVNAKCRLMRLRLWWTRLRHGRRQGV